MQRGLIAAAVAVLASTAAPAATRTFSVTSFDRIRVEGPFAVTLRTGTGSSGRAEGPDPRALDRIRIDMMGRTLVIRRDQEPGPAPKDIRITVSTPAIVSAALLGTGSLAVDAGRGPRFDVLLSGAGTIAVATLDTDQLNVTITGAGTARLAGRTRQLRAIVQGAGTIDAAPLTAQDAVLTSAGTGIVTLAATRTARIDASGSGAITVTGTPACTVRSAGSVDVACGR